MSNIICLCLGLILGMPLGWAVVLVLADISAQWRQKTPTKDEWKVM